MSHDPETGEILDGDVLSNENDPVVKRGRVRTSMGAYFDKLLNKLQKPDGSEVPDSVPMQPPLGYRRQPTMVEYIRDMVRSEQLRAAAEASEMESFEEADDFDVADEFEPISAYEFEEIFEPVRAADSPAAQADRPEAPEAPPPAKPVPVAPAAPAAPSDPT